MMKKNPLGYLSANVLKIIAAVAMTFDHFAMIFYPYDMNLRIPGRIAFPIFAFLIAEGFRYTGSRLRYFLTMASCATVCQTVFYLATGGENMCVFVTFAISILLCWLLESVKRALLSPELALWKRCLAPLPLLAAIFALWLLNRALVLDYGFFGCLLPMCTTLLHPVRGKECEALSRLDSFPVHLLCFTLCLIPMNFSYHAVQHYALLALPLLMLYSGKRGRLKLKYFFYVYYPLHLVVLYGLHMLFAK